MHFKNLHVGTRLGMGFAAVLTLLILVAGTGFWSLHKDGELADKLVNDALVKERLITEWHDSTQANGVRSVAIAEIANGDTRAPIEQSMKNVSGRISEIQKTLAGFKNNAQETALYADIASKRAVYLAARERVVKAKKEGNEDEAKKLNTDNVAPALATYLLGIRALVEYEASQIKSIAADLDSQNDMGKMLVGIFGAAALLVGMLASFFITRSLVKQLGGEPGAAADIATRIADGDLGVTIALRENDRTSLMYAMKAMRDNLVSIVGQVRTGTDAIATASREIAVGNQDLSSRTETQASSLEKTASSMEELTSTVKQNADNASQANELALSASHIAVQGGTVVAHVVRTMESINDSSKKIVDIISVIDGIAFQTNILALNAAVEAARAGEEGRGFAVVATEVRNLAQRSASAAREIKALIGDSVDKVATGTKLVDQAGVTMGEIVASVKRVTDIMAEITMASREQTAGIEQVNEAIAQMDQTTQQNAALVEQAAAAAESLQDQAGNLAQVVSVFKFSGAQETPVAPQAGKPQKAKTSATPIARKAMPAGAPRTVTGRGKPVVGDEWEEF
ncbi:MAG: MCP four helix bundle domain-containing protein [Herminiimonas sp.]|nr:MCP four helix bundle domain-containing protein [Herminiimonas sp.]